MLIREATKADSKAIVICLLLAMEDIIFKFIGNDDQLAARNLLQHLVTAEQNQYSYENCLVVELNGQLIAAVNCYDGAKMVQLREPVLQYIRANYNVNFDPEPETEAGEYYIDSLGVVPDWQGRGIGSMLLNYLIERHVVQYERTLGLLVEVDNPNAKKLYLKLGFETVGTKLLVGKQMDHLQIQG